MFLTHSLFSLITKEWSGSFLILICILPVHLILAKEATLRDWVITKGVNFATIEAVPESGYLFVEWRGGLSGTDPVQQVEIIRDFQLEAIFEPIISPNASPAENISNAVKAIEALDHLSTEEKQQSLIELLLFGSSSTAGFLVVINFYLDVTFFNYFLFSFSFFSFSFGVQFFERRS